MPIMSKRNSSLLLAVCLAAVLWPAPGCDRGPGEEDPGVAMWREKFETLAEKNEQVYAELEGLRERERELEEQAKGLPEAPA